MVIEILVTEYNLQNKKTRFLCRTYGSPSFKDKLERDIEVASGEGAVQGHAGSWSWGARN